MTDLKTDVRESCPCDNCSYDQLSLPVCIECGAELTMFAEKSEGKKTRDVLGSTVERVVDLVDKT